MRDVVRLLCIFFSFFLLLLPHIYRYCDHLTYIVLIFWYIYIYIYADVCLFTYLFMCYFFSIFIHMFLYVCILLFLFHTKMPWWVLLKVFQKDKLSKSIMPRTLFLQSFLRVCVRILFYCEFSDLWLLSYFICLLWFCHGMPKGDIIKDIFFVIG